MMTDNISDLLTRIRNANKTGLETLQIPYSKLKESVAKLLVEEGFLKDVQVVGDSKKSLVVQMKYRQHKHVLTGLKRVSKPGRRVYVGCDEIKPIRNGMGIAILSTPKGVMTDIKARQQRVGGEWLCSVW